MDLHAAYERLPPPLQDAAATLRGAQLARTRYGPDTERLVAEAHEREAWDQATWATWREQRLAVVLHRAATLVPWYREHWAARRRAGDHASIDDLANWPILEKEEVRRNPEAFLAEDHPRRALIADHTSGTTGTPLTLWFDRDSARRWYALFDARCRGWHGVDRHDRVAMLGGQVVVPTSRERPPYWVKNRAMHQLYLSMHHIRTDRAAAYAEAMARHRTTYLLGYPSAMVALAHALDEAPVEAPKLRVAITNAEPLPAADRERIGAAFGAPVHATYGMAEVVAAATECPAGTLHDFPDVGWLEVVDDGHDHTDEPAGTGDLVATGLVNDAMPLVRYRVGDRMTPPTWEGERCSCGRALPSIAHVSGRSDDVVWTPDGRAVGRLDHIFKADLPILEAQVIQEDRAHVRVLVVPAEGWDAEQARVVAARTRERVGDMAVEVETVASIARTPAGKFRAVISKVSRPEV